MRRSNEPAPPSVIWYGYDPDGEPEYRNVQRYRVSDADALFKWLRERIVKMRQKALRYLIRLRQANRRLQRLDVIVAAIRREERRRERTYTAQEKASDALFQIQDLLNCGRTNTQAVTAVRELVEAMGAPLRSDPRRNKDESSAP